MSDMAERICCIEQMNGQVVEELGHKPITVKPASTDTTYSHNTRYVVFLCRYRPYAIPHVTKRETDSGRKSGYYAAILSGKEDRGIGA